MTNRKIWNRIHDAIGVHDKDGKETETQMVWPHLKILWHGEYYSAGDSERSKKERKTEEEMGRYYQGMDRNGVGDSLRAAEDREG